MTDLRKAAEMALEALEELRFANAPFLDEAMEALRAALAQTEQDLAYQEAKLLAQKLYKRHYQHDKHYVSGHVVWEPLDTTVGVITQIDNMVSGLVRPQPEQECVYPQCETAGGCDGPCGAAVKQGPVGWAFREHLEALGVDFSKPCAEGNGEEVGPESPLGKRPHTSTPLYIAPPKREWQGLTDEEIEDAWIEASDEYDDTISINNLGRILEAKLKEKNT